MNYRCSLCNCNLIEFFKILDNKYRPVVYLAGPMQYTNDNGETWRQTAQKLIEGSRMSCISPLEYEEQAVGKEGLKAIQGYYTNGLEDYPSEFVVKNMHALMAADLYAVENSDYLLVYYSGEKISGTAHECGHAWTLGKKCILVNNCKSVHDIPLWFFSCFSKVFNTLEEAVNYIKEKENKSAF